MQIADRELDTRGFVARVRSAAFVQNLRRSEDDRAFVHTLIDLARRLGLETVAEWVQDEESAAMLADWGCDYIQGALVGLLARTALAASAAGARRREGLNRRRHQDLL